MKYTLIRRPLTSDERFGLICGVILMVGFWLLPFFSPRMPDLLVNDSDLERDSVIWPSTSIHDLQESVSELRERLGDLDGI
jgi:hypothetical protein